MKLWEIIGFGLIILLFVIGGSKVEGFGSIFGVYLAFLIVFGLIAKVLGVWDAFEKIFLITAIPCLVLSVSVMSRTYSGIGGVGSAIGAGLVGILLTILPIIITIVLTGLIILYTFFAKIMKKQSN